MMGGGSFNVEHPLVVRKQRAALHLHRSDNIMLSGESDIALRQGWLVAHCIGLRGPGHALRTAGIKEMNVSVDDGNGSGCRCHDNGGSGEE